MSFYCVQRAAAAGWPRRQLALSSNSRLSLFSSLLHTSSVVRNEAQKDASEGTENANTNTIYLGSLPAAVRKGLIRRKLNELGATNFKEVRIREFRKNQIAFGFIRCDTPEDARSVMERIPKDWTILGFKIKAEYARNDAQDKHVSTPNRDDDSILYVGGTGELMKKGDIGQALTEAGVQGTWRISIPKKSKWSEYEPRYAFVRFANGGEARSALRYIVTTGGLFIHDKPAIVSLYSLGPRPRPGSDTSPFAAPTTFQLREPSTVLVVRLVKAADTDDDPGSGREEKPSGTVESVRALLGDLVPEIIEEIPSTLASEGHKPESQPELRVEFKSPADAILAHGRLNHATAPGWQTVRARFLREKAQDLSKEKLETSRKEVQDLQV